MPRGISETDVWNACDALLLEGARPTIERVRKKIGSGSPNTVSPFLDTWFRHLGGRIKDPGAFSAPLDVPDPVLQAAQHFWETALAETRRDFDQRLSEGMAAAIANVEAEKERAAQSDAAAFDATAKVARLQAQVGELLAAIEQERLGRATVQADLVHTRLSTVDLQSRLARADDALQSERGRHRDALRAADERADGATRRAALEIEKERQARASADKRATAAQAKLDSVHAELVDVKTFGAVSLAEVRNGLQTARRDAEVLKAELTTQVEHRAVLLHQLADATSRADRAEAEARLVKIILAEFKLHPAAVAGRFSNKQQKLHKT